MLLNNLGYRMLQDERLGDSLAVLKCGTEEFPERDYLWHSRGRRRSSSAGTRRGVALAAQARVRGRSPAVPRGGQRAGSLPVPPAWHGAWSGGIAEPLVARPILDPTG